MATYGQIKVKTLHREEIHILSFGNRTAFFDTLRYIRNNRKDLVIIDDFWGYALYNDKTSAVETLEHFR